MESRELTRSDGWSHGVRLYGPVSTLRPVADDVWIVDGPVIRMRVGPVALPLPTRMIVVRLPGGALWLWSPTAPEPRLFDAIDELGRVAHLVSPNKLHYAGIPGWQARYPDATAWASPGVRERARAHHIDIRWGGDLGDEVSAGWASAIELLVIRGSRFVEEVAFFHRPSATLILCDLVMALEADRLRAPWRWIFAIVGAVGRGRTPRELSATFVGRRAQARAAYEHLVAWQPRRVLFAHGACFLDDAAARLAHAFRWVR
jgi:hypothetical protein